TINKSPFKIGRSNVTDDYVIVDNRSISRGHATFVIKNDVCYVTDNRSLNKTFVNGTVLDPEKEHPLSNGDNVKLYNERFVYLKSSN
ncbi:MAG: FHA domain-containing protein, partial [Clostridia bacterium]|nr:FHA domain-containing protein [Clostridia bacterium]